MFHPMQNRRPQMQRRYITVDVFTDRAFGGNPLAVVLDAGGLATAQMQSIASEFNYSETTFVLPPEDPTHDAQVRIFTVASRDALRRARPDASAFASTFPCDGSDAVYFYIRDVPAAEACD